ncbi:MAG: Crp/Fnr family transcriptional regulator [Oscillospiraceae bacterium]|nr:Crp/Fnr family transcriptional regulator [Oscillospiraceae bacterium]
MKTLNKTFQASTVHKILEKNLPFYNELSKKQKQQLFDACILRSFSPYETIHNYLNKNYGLYIILESGIQAFALAGNGKEFSLFAISPGKNNPFVCDIILIDESGDDIDFQAVAGLSVLYIPLDDWNEFMENSHLACKYTIAIKNKMIEVIVRSMRAFVFLSLEQMLIMHLYQKLSLERLIENDTATIKGTHEEIANTIGTSREVVSRILRKFQADGLLKTAHGKIIILDVSALENRVSSIFSQPNDAFPNPV